MYIIYVIGWELNRVALLSLQVTGGKVTVTEGKAGIVLSGAYDETQTAQCLVHGFILCEQHLVPSK